MTEKSYIFASSKPWNTTAFSHMRHTLPGVWAEVGHKEDLGPIVRAVKPRYVFFAHWSHIVDDDILENTECVCFHMTDVPYGRGGSPLQNLIVNGHSETQLTALRMVSKLDAGPIYMKRHLSLAGSALGIFERAADLSMTMIKEIVEFEPTPQAQTGEVTLFKRRKPEQSRITETMTSLELYDHIRMLDAPTYPHAFLDFGRWRLFFTEAQQKGDEVESIVRFTESKDFAR